MAKISPVSIKYMVFANFKAEGPLEKPDVIGAIFGQTEGLLGSDLEMRELQKEGKIGRIEVELNTVDGRTVGEIKVPSALDKSETTIIAAALETIERVGPTDTKITIDEIEDVRGSKRDFILERAKKLMEKLGDGGNDMDDAIIKHVIDYFKEKENIDLEDDKREIKVSSLEHFDDAMQLATAIRNVKQNVNYCSICCNIGETDPCHICKDHRRDHKKVCVVEQPKDLFTIEKAGFYEGVYHVLFGHIDPLENVEPEDINIDKLVDRARNNGIQEVIIATNPNLEGDVTAMYILEQLEPLGVKVTQLARGMPSGSYLEYANSAVIADAIHGRKSIQKD